MSAGILRRIVRRLRRMVAPKRAGSSSAYAVIEREAMAGLRLDGWDDAAVASRQDAAFGALLAAMRKGAPREDLRVLARAIDVTGPAENAGSASGAVSLLEVGCGSGYNSEVIAHLAATSVRYTGLDYAEAMVAQARARYPDLAFVHGDATALPFDDRAFDIVLNGVALMHIPDYAAAIAESARVARRWSIFHTVVLLAERPTTFLTKRAYGSPTIEVIINESELRRLFSENNLKVRHEYTSVPYDLFDVLGEHTITRTFVCEATA